MKLIRDTVTVIVGLVGCGAIILLLAIFHFEPAEWVVEISYAIIKVFT